MKAKNYINFFLAFTFASLYGFLWANVDVLTGVGFDAILDRSNYLYYAGSSYDIWIQNLEQHPVILFFNEPFFLMVMFLFSSAVSNEILILRILICLISFISAYICFRETKSVPLTIVILFVPQIFGNYVMSLRQGVAVALFIYAFFSKVVWLRFLLFFVLPFIHTSFYITLALALMTYFLLETTKKRFFLIFASVAFIFLFINGSLYLADYLGVRQAAGYIAGDDIEVGFGGAVFWGFILLLFITMSSSKCLDVKSNIKFSYLFAINLILFYLISYFLAPALSRSIQNHALLIFILAWTMFSQIGRWILSASLGVYAALTFYLIYDRGILSGFMA